MELLQIAQVFIGVVSFVLLGVFAFFSIYDRFRNQRTQELSALDEKNINALKQRIEILETQAENDQIEREKLKKDMQILQVKHDELAVLVDPGIQTRQAEINHKLDTVVKGQNTTNSNLERLFVAIEKHLDVKK